MQEDGGSSRTEEGEGPRVLAFFVSCRGLTAHAKTESQTKPQTCQRILRHARAV